MIYDDGFPGWGGTACASDHHTPGPPGLGFRKSGVRLTLRIVHHLLSPVTCSTACGHQVPQAHAWRRLHRGVCPAWVDLRDPVPRLGTKTLEGLWIDFGKTTGSVACLILGSLLTE